MAAFDSRAQIAVSACLLGQAVRYDGKHKYNPLIAEVLSLPFNLLPICPEVEIGLGIPRAKIQLNRVNQQTRLQGVENPNQDVTEAIIRLAQNFIKQHRLSGLVVQERSPSCGFGSTPVFDFTGQPLSLNNGLFTETVLTQKPDLPVIQAEQLSIESNLIDFIHLVKQKHHEHYCS